MGRKSKEQLEEEQRLRSLTIYVVISLFLVIVYTIVEQILSTVTGVTHDVLTTCFFACFGGETVVCGVIKIFKIVKEDRYGQIDE